MGLIFVGNRFRGARGRAVAGLVIAGWMIAGCPLGGPPGNPSPSNFIDGNIDESVSSPLGKTSGEPNDDFSIPVVGVAAGNLFRLKGTVQTSDDLDVFRLGAFTAGDRLRIDAQASGSLDVSIALFDAEGRLVSENDDASPAVLDSQLEFIVRHDGNPYFLVVTRSAFADSRRRTGGYTVRVEVTRGGSVPAPQQQTLFLKFDGGALRSPDLGNIDLDPFDAGRISRAYTGRTQEIKDVILSVMQQNFERFNVIVRSSDDGIPGGAGISTIWFGGFNDGAFGIAENVDLYNAEHCDDAIIYTESFAPFLFSSTPSAQEMGVAIGNVATHEAGHLLGLNHVDDDFDIMDDRSPADAFLFDQEFMESPLSSDIMPIGTQDGVLLLDEIVGPALGSTTKRIARPYPLTTLDSRGLGGVEIVRRQGRSDAK